MKELRFPRCFSWEMGSLDSLGVNTGLEVEREDEVFIALDEAKLEDSN